MEMHPLRVFLTVAAEKSFSRAAEKLLRTQPAISLSIQRLETELGEKADRPVRQGTLLLTDAGKIVLEYARRFLRTCRATSEATLWPNCATNRPGV